ncbi:MAG: protein kinase [Phycisphaera sp.]|nr:protein kinase [Phycisphaera sp.]
MDLEFVVDAGPDKGVVFNAPANGAVLFGRSDAAQCRLKDPDVALVHFEIRLEDGSLWLSDCGAPEGTLINGRKSKSMELQEGDEIQVGQTTIRLQKSGRAPTAAPVGAPGQSSAGGAKAQAAAALKSGVAKVWWAGIPGSTFQDTFEIGNKIAEGRSSIVFEGRDTRKSRKVAIKVLKPEFASTDEKVQRFIRAMKTVLPLRHPNLVEVYGAGKYGDVCWAALEWIDGESLDKVIERIGIAGMLQWTYGYKVALHVARALKLAYDQHIIHRNITPTNIFMTTDGVTKLGDLNIAKKTEGEGAEDVTMGDSAGKKIGEDVNFMAPEARTGGEVDTRSDIYALGATVYALLTGRVPYEGANPMQVLMGKVEIVPPKKYQMAIPDMFEKTVKAMLSIRPEDRFDSPGKLLAELDRVAKFTGASTE